MQFYSEGVQDFVDSIAAGDEAFCCGVLDEMFVGPRPKTLAELFAHPVHAAFVDADLLAVAGELQ